MGNAHPSIAPYEPLRCADTALAVACGNDGQFARLTGALGIPDLAEDPRFVTNADRVANRGGARRGVGGAAGETDTAAHWEGRILAASVAAAPVNDLGAAFARARELGLAPTFSVGDDHPEQVRNPILFSGKAIDGATAPPDVGEHTPSWRTGSPPTTHDPPSTSRPGVSREHHTQPERPPRPRRSRRPLQRGRGGSSGDSVRTMCERRITPYVADWFERGEIDDVRGLAKELGELGVLGMHLTGYGCAGMSAVEYGLACLEPKPAIRASGRWCRCRIPGDVRDLALGQRGEQKQRWLPDMAAGTAIGCSASPSPTTAPTRGACAPAPAATGTTGFSMARRCGSPTARSPMSPSWGTDRRGHPRLGGADRLPRFSAPLIKHKMSLRASVTSELVFDDVRLPGDAVFPRSAASRAAVPPQRGPYGGIVWGALGAARSALEAAITYAGEREQFGQPIAGSS